MHLNGTNFFVSFMNRALYNTWYGIFLNGIMSSSLMDNAFCVRDLLTGIRPVNRKIVKYVHIHLQAYTSLKKYLTVLFSVF